MLLSPEESKETAQGFRGTQLCWQSLVCYTFAKERTAEANSAFPVQAMKLNKIKAGR